MTKSLNKETAVKPHSISFLQEKNESSSNSSEVLHTIFHLGTKSNKFLITVRINTVPLEMEVDSWAARSTVPLGIKIYSDFKVSSNPFYILTCIIYLHHRIYLVCTLTNGESDTKLDLARADKSKT